MFQLAINREATVSDCLELRNGEILQDAHDWEEKCLLISFKLSTQCRFTRMRRIECFGAWEGTNALLSVLSMLKGTGYFDFPCKAIWQVKIPTKIAFFLFFFFSFFCGLQHGGKFLLLMLQEWQQ